MVINIGNHHHEIVMTLISCLTILQRLRQDICILIDNNNSNNNNNNNPTSIEMVIHSFDDHDKQTSCGIGMYHVLIELPSCSWFNKVYYVLSVIMWNFNVIKSNFIAVKLLPDVHGSIMYTTY